MQENNNNIQPANQPQYIYVQQPRYENDEVEIDLIELFGAIWKRKWFVCFVTFIFTAAALAYSLWLPFIYRAECKFVTQGGGGAASSLMAQYGGIASMMGVSVPTKATPAGTMIETMKSNSVVDAVIDRFNLMEENEWVYRINARKAVLKILDAKEDAMSGIVSVAYKDESPQRAADITNAFVEELQKKMLDISLSDARQRRAFFETQFLQAQQELYAAEDAMAKFQESIGVIIPDDRARRILVTISSLRTQITAKNVEINSLRSYLHKDNPRLKLAENQLEALQKELSKLEEEQKATESGRVNRSNANGTGESLSAMPELSVEYHRNERNLREKAARYQTMLTQYEAAKLNEVNDLSIISIVDPATPPDYKYEPSRARITIVGMFLGLMISCGKIAVPYIISQSKKSRKRKYDDDDDYGDFDDD